MIEPANERIAYFIRTGETPAGTVQGSRGLITSLFAVGTDAEFNSLKAKYNEKVTFICKLPQPPENRQHAVAVHVEVKGVGGQITSGELLSNTSVILPQFREQIIHAAQDAKKNNIMINQLYFIVTYTDAESQPLNILGTATGLRDYAKAFMNEIKELGMELEVIFIGGSFLINLMNSLSLPATGLPHRNFLKLDVATAHMDSLFDVYAPQDFLEHYSQKDPAPEQISS